MYLRTYALHKQKLCFSALAPLVLRGACPQCSPKEARQIRQILSYVQRNYPWEWSRIMRQYGWK